MITVTTHTSWFSRIGSSVAGVLIGLLLLAAAIFGLFWNEGRAVKTARSLAEGAGLVVSVPNTAVSPSNEGKLVHITGPLAIAEPLSDAEFGVSTPGVRLERRVEMYQWVEDSESETRTKLGGGEETVTTYTYARQWSDDPVDSSEFKQAEGHYNPPPTVEDRSIQASQGSLGAFTLGDEVLSRVTGDQPVPLGPEQAEAIRQAAGERPLTVADNRILLPAASPATGPAEHNSAGSTAAEPRVGDIRISYTVVPAGEISAIGAQAGSGLSPYQSKAGDALLLVQRGAVSAEAMFQKAVDDNNTMTWIIRAVGIVALMIGFGLLMAPIAVIADVIPFLGSVVRLGTAIVGFVLAIMVGFITIAVAWFAYRPLLSIVLLLVAGGVTAAFVLLGRKKDRAAAAAATEAAPA